jgi:hypothetical protein
MLYGSLVVSPDHCVYKRVLPFAFTPSSPAKFKHLALTGRSTHLHRPSRSSLGEHHLVAMEKGSRRRRPARAAPALPALPEVGPYCRTLGSAFPADAMKVASRPKAEARLTNARCHVRTYAVQQTVAATLASRSPRNTPSSNRTSRRSRDFNAEKISSSSANDLSVQLPFMTWRQRSSGSCGLKRGVPSGAKAMNPEAQLIPSDASVKKSGRSSIAAISLSILSMRALLSFTGWRPEIDTPSYRWTTQRSS